MENKDFNKKNETLSHKVGDGLERLGQKITNAGAQKIGKAVYDAGNKIEHMSEEEETSSPSQNRPV